MERYKWFWIRSPLGFEDSVDAISSCRFDERIGYGFEKICKAEDGAVYIGFVQEHNVLEHYTNPYGETISYEIKKYIEVLFDLSAYDEELILMRVTDPPRSIKALRNALSKVLGFGFSIDYVEVDVLQFLKEVRDLKDAKSCRITKVKASGIEVGENSVATVVVTSPRNALEDIQTRFSESSYRVEQLKFSVVIDNQRQAFEVSSVGSLYVGYELHKSVIEAMKTAFELG